MRSPGGSRWRVSFEGSALELPISSQGSSPCYEEGVPLAIGQALHGKYRLLRLLGDGGMGAVYEATHERLGTRVAIKVLHAEIARRPGIVDRFLQEARVSAQIKSPHVVQVIDVDQTPEGDAYMVMDLLLGETLLAALERERKLPLRVATDYTLQILEGLEAAHALGVVHRDLKPENVFVTSALAGHTKKPTLKLIDFGIAKVRRADLSSALTLAGIAMGTAEYMAPEQAFSANVADARSDLYAVGVMLYEMLSGQRPVIGDDPRAIALKVERGELKSLVHLAPEVPPPLAGLVHRAMAARPEMRFQTAAEMRAAIEASLARIESDPALSATAALEGAHPGAYRPPTGTLGLAPAAARQPSTLRGTPVDHAFGHAPAMQPATEPEPELEPESLPEPRGVPRKRGMGIGVLLLAVLLGVGVVVALAMAQQPKNTADPAPSQTTPIGSLAAVTVTTATEDGASLRPLTSSPTMHSTPGPLPSAKPTVSARPTASSLPHPPDASTTSPLPLPTDLPNPLPSTIPPLPTAFPSSFSTTFTLPGFGPPPQSPPP